MRALQMLRAFKSQEAILPEPLSEPEIIERLSRLMLGAGRRNSRLAFIKAFPKRLSVENAKEALGYDPTGFDVTQLPDTLKRLYKKYPEIKQAGFPKGYPVGKGIAAQKEWVRKAALKIELDRRAAAEADTLIDLDAAPQDPNPPDTRVV